MWYIIPTVVGKGLNLCILDMFSHKCSGLKMSKLLCTNVPRICSYLLCSFSHLWFTVSTVVRKGLNLCILDMFDQPAVVSKCLNFNVQMVQEFVHYYCVVFLHVVYHTYSGQNRSKFVYFSIFDHTCSGLKSLNFYGFMHVIYCTYSGWKKV